MPKAPRTRLFRHGRLSLFLTAEEIHAYTVGVDFLSIYFKGGEKTMLWSSNSSTLASPKWPEPMFQTIADWLNQAVGNE
jgi:hypothetical protein